MILNPFRPKRLRVRDHIRRAWAFVFGGDYPQRVGGYGWRPNIVRHVARYYRQDWRSAGYTLREWVVIDGKW